MKKVVTYGVAAVVLAAASLVAATPAYAAGGTLTISNTTDWTPGQVVSVTLVDTADPICTNSMIGAPWALGLEIRDANDNVIGGAFALEPTGTYALNQTWNVDLQVGWLNEEASSDVPTYGLAVSVVGVCQDSPESTSTNVPSTRVSATYSPITATAGTVAPGGSVDVTVSDASQTWCDGSTGSGYSMGFALIPDSGDWIYIPAGIDAGSGVAGLGSFTWNDTSATVTLTVPSTVPVGTYTLFAGCVTDSADGYLQPGPGMIVADFEVATALPDTGSSNGQMAWTIGAVSIALLALGAGLFFIRRRVS